MKKPAAPSITNLIGVLLVVVAIVSAGGIYYISSEYCKISEALVYTETSANLMISHNNVTKDTIVTLSALVDNPSSLDIEIYRIEFMTYADRSTSAITDYDKYIGSGSTSEGNSTIAAGSLREFQISFQVTPGTLNMERYQYALDGGTSLWAYANGMIWFKIVNYPEATQKLGLFYINEVFIHYV